MYPVKTEKIKLTIKSEWMKSAKAYIVYITFATTILLWLTDFLHGMNSYIVAMIPVAVFSSLGIINKSDLKNISWDVLWLVSGGIALGLGLEVSGLAERLINVIPFGSLSPILIVGFSNPRSSRYGKFHVQHSYSKSAIAISSSTRCFSVKSC